MFINEIRKFRLNFQSFSRFCKKDVIQEGGLSKYLRVKQARISHQTMKTETDHRICKRLRQGLQININSKNLFKALNKYTCSTVGYSFGPINWSKPDRGKIATERYDTTYKCTQTTKRLMVIDERLDNQIAN